MITAAEKFDKVPPWCVVKKGRENSPSWRVRETVTPADGLGKYASTRGEWCSGDWFATEPEARRIARLTRPLPSWEPAPDCALPVEGWKVCPAGGGWIVAHQPDTKHAWFNVDPGRVFDTRRAAIVWAWTEAPAPEERKPITEADVKVGQVWVCGLATCEHRRRVDGISGGRVRTTWLSPRQGCDCDSVEMAEFIAYLNRDPASRLLTPCTVATDGPSDELTMVADRVRLVEGEAKALAARVGKVEGVLARIGSMESFIAESQALANRMTIVERLVAAQVPVPAKVNVRSDAASTVEAMTEAAASNEGWREMLVSRSYAGWGDWLYTPDGKLWWSDAKRMWHDVGERDDRSPCADTSKTAKHRRKCPPPPNLAEWYKPGHVPEAGKMVDDTADRAERLDTLASLRGDVRAAEAAYDEARKQIDAVRDAVPRTYRIPGERIECGVRNLASAHDLGVKAQAELRTQLAAAQTAAANAEGRAATATKRASEAESKLADARAALERVQRELAETNALLTKALESAETPT